MAADWQIRDRIPDPETGWERWEIHKILRGGMGIVYVVYDHDWRLALCAIKWRDREPRDGPAKISLDISEVFL
jgi:hypothetical protein